MHSTAEDNDLILIRHGQSDFNKGFLDYLQVNQLALHWQDCIKIDQFNEKVSYAREHIDCHLTEQGKKQCNIARQALQDMQIDVVLVSPHQRALETCREIFRGRKIPIEVHPVIAEVFRYSCDISNHIEDKMKEFADYDFGHMKDSSELWFIDYLAQHHKDTCELHLEQKQLSFKQKQTKVLELIKSKVIYESPQELRERTWKIKEVLYEMRKKYKRIAIVSHYNVIRHLICSQFDEEGEPVHPEIIYNAQPMFRNIGELIKYK